MALTQSFEAIKLPVGLAESVLEAAWVKIESDEGNSTASDWEGSQCGSPRCAGPSAPGLKAVLTESKAKAPIPDTALKSEPKQTEDQSMPETSCDLKADYYPAELESVVELASTYKVLLKTHCPAFKQLAMFVGDAEGKALQQALRGFKWQIQGCRRPLTYDFLTNVVEALGRKVMFVRICASERGVFYARAHFHPVAGGKPDNATLHGVDSRPSDALNVALRCDAQVFVHRQLIAAVN